MVKIIQDPEGNLVELSGNLKAETEKAILFYNGKVEVWVPKSQIEEQDNHSSDPELITIIIPEWLAFNKELI